MPEISETIILGVDTHECEHVAALVDPLGGLLATTAIRPVEQGFLRLLGWAGSHGALRRAAVEGTGSFGVGLARFLVAHGIEVIEITRPSRGGQRHLDKSDPIDAAAAARALLAGEATATAPSP